MITIQEENKLIDRVLAGEERCYADLVDRYKSYAFTIALRIVNNRPEAEEVAQDAFVKAYNYLRTFNRQARFSTLVVPDCFSIQRSVTKERIS
ncbi:MAG: sigma factor [Bacteroidota bacterium]